MNRIQKLIGTIFPPYKYSQLRRESCLLVMSVINALPAEYNFLKDEIMESKILNLGYWALLPNFKFITKSFDETFLRKYKKRGNNFKLIGIKIYSRKNDNFEKVSLVIWDNFLSGINIENSNYQLEEFDLSRITVDKLAKEPIQFPPSDIDIFLDSLDSDIKTLIDIDSIFDIELNGRTYYAFYELGDGNYLAIDKNKKVYSLVHDAKPASKLVKTNLISILQDIKIGKFNKEQHLENRYKLSS